MKIVLSELLEDFQVIKKVLNHPIDTVVAPIDSKLSYRLTKITNKMLSVARDYSKAHNALVIKYGTEKIETLPSGELKSTGRIEVTKENTEVFTKEDEALKAVEIDLGIDLIPVGIINGTGLKLTAQERVVLEKYVDQNKE